MSNDFKLPLVGLGTSYNEFSKENPDAGVRCHRGGLRRLLETELAMARCEFDQLKGYYETLDRDDSLYLAGVTNSVVGALGRGDLKLFDRILRDLQKYQEGSSHPYARLGYEITMAWIRQFLRVRRGYPEWMVRGNLTLIPEEWKRQCAYLCVKRIFGRREYDSAYLAASMLLNFDSRKDVLSAFPVYERLVCGLACHELGVYAGTDPDGFIYGIGRTLCVRAGRDFGIIRGEGRQAMCNYMAIIHKEPNGWYSAEVPALPGCYTDGATLDEIHFNLKEAIQLYLQDQPENVEPVEMMQVCV